MTGTILTTVETMEMSGLVLQGTVHVSECVSGDVLLMQFMVNNSFLIETEGVFPCMGSRMLCIFSSIG